MLNELDFCFPYLCDILIASKSSAEQKLRLQQVLTRFGKYNLAINPSKCKFSDKIKAIIDFLQP